MAFLPHKRCRLALVAIAASLASAYLASAAATPASKASEPLPQSANVGIDLVLSGGNLISAESTISVSAPRNSTLGRQIARLSTETPDSTAYGRDVLSAFQTGNILAFPEAFLLSQRTYPVLTITPSRVGVSATQAGQGPWNPGLPSAPASLVLDYNAIPQGVTLIARVFQRRGTINRADPTPSEVEGNEVTWRLTGPSSAGRLTIVPRPSPPLLSSGPSFVQPVLDLLAAVLPALVLLAAMLRQQHFRTEPGSLAQARTPDLRRLSVWSLAIAAAAAGGWLCEHLRLSGAWVLAVVALPLPFLAAGTAISALQYTSADRASLLRTAGAVAGVVGIAGVTLIGLVAATRFGRSLLDRNQKQQARRSQHAHVPRYAVWTAICLACFAVAFVLVGQPVLSVYRSQSALPHPVLAMPGFSFRPGIGANQFLLFSFVSWLLSLSSLLLAANVLILGLALVLIVAAPHSPSSMAPLSPIYRVLAVLAFATLVVGTGGTVHGYATPIPFVLALVIGSAVLRWRSRVLHRQVVLSAASDSPVRKDALERSIGLLALSRREQEVYDKLGEGSIDFGEYRALRREIEVNRNKLLDLHSLVREAPRRQVTQGELEQLSFGIGPGTGAAGRVAALRPLGWLCAAIPAALTGYFVIKTHGAAAISANNPFGIAFLTFSVLSGAAFWFAAAALLASTFPPLPGINGVAKGLLLAAAFAVVWIAPSAWLDSTQQAGGSLPLVAAELGLSLAAAGALLDRRTILEQRVYWRHQFDLYRLGGVRSAILLLSPILLLSATVAQQLAAGHTTSAATSVVKAAPSIASNLPPTRR